MTTINKRPQPDIRQIARLIPPSGNLVQGQNEVALYPGLAAALNEAVAAGLNSYSYAEGTDELRRSVAEKVRLFNGVPLDADKRPLELLITHGATGGLVTFAQRFLSGGAAVIFEPYYPYHKKTLENFNARVEVVGLRGDDLALDLDELRRVCREGAGRARHPLRAIIVCSPANPTGRVFTREELGSIVEIAAESNLLILSDEVYEHFAVDSSDHIATASVEGAWERTVTISSFSKSWAVSGWRLGYLYGPGALVSQIAPLVNIYYVCSPTPLQHALARVLLANPDYYVRLRKDFARKRGVLTHALTASGFKVYPSRSSFYAWARIPERFEDAGELNEFLMKEAGVAGVPGSAFMDEPEPDAYMRLCFAREDDMLEAASERLLKALA